MASLNLNGNITYFAHMFCDIPCHLHGDAGKITWQSCGFFLAYPFQIVFNQSTYLPMPYILRLSQWCKTKFYSILCKSSEEMSTHLCLSTVLYRRVGCKFETPRALNLGLICRWVFKWKRWTLYPAEKALNVPSEEEAAWGSELVWTLGQWARDTSVAIVTLWVTDNEGVEVGL